MILAYANIMFMLQGELLPADKRSIGSGLLGIMDNVALFASIKTVPTLTSTLGIYGTFWLYSSIVFCVVGCAIFFMPETRGKTLEEIEKNYKEKK